MFKATSPPVVAVMLFVSSVTGPALAQADRPQSLQETSRAVAPSPAAPISGTPSKPRDLMTSRPVSAPVKAAGYVVIPNAGSPTAVKPVGRLGAVAAPRSAPLASAAAATVTNMVVSTAPLDQFQPAAIPDGGGGYIIAWTDYRNGTTDIYATRLSGAGVALWAPNGVPVYKGAGFQNNPMLVSDGLGGVIVAWQDDRNGNADIFAQRLSAFGVPQWNVNAVEICTAAGSQLQPSIIPDGADGAVISWEDHRGSSGDIYAQRINDLGGVLWTANGVAVSAATGDQQNPAMVGDGFGGAIAAWRDFRGGAESDLYAQRIGAAGAALWTLDGVAVCAATGNQELPSVATDAAGGAIVGWADARTPANGLDVYAQRLNASGAIQWTLNGVALATATGDQTGARVVSDAAGGAVAVWRDFRGGATSDIYARRINGSGVPQWAANGVAVCTAANNQLSPTVVPDNGGGGALVAWSDGRTPANGLDIYGQRLDSNGAALWTANGVLLADAAGDQDEQAVVANGVGGALVAWRDRRSGTNFDIYAQPVDAGGRVPGQCVPPAALGSGTMATAAAVTNNYSFDQAEFFWTAVGVRSATADWDIEVFDAETYGLVSYPICFGDPLGGSYQTSGVDFVVGNFNDNRNPPAIHNVRAFRASGTGSGTVEWDDGGVITGNDPDYFPINDNQLKSRTTGATDVLECWDAFLAAGLTYTIQFRRTSGTADTRMLLFSSAAAPLGSTYWAPRSARALEAQSDAIFTAPVTAWYGIVVVNDNGQTGGYQIGVKSGVQTIGVGDRTPVASGLKSMMPNPSRGDVKIQFQLHEPGQVGFQIFDMAGRSVSRIPENVWEPGTWNVGWDGRGDHGQRLKPGLYFIQMTANNRVVGLGRLTLLN